MPAVADELRAPLRRARGKLGAVDTAVESLAREGDVVRTAGLELPAECLLEEAPGCLEVPCREFNVVELLVCRHGCLPWLPRHYYHARRTHATAIRTRLASAANNHREDEQNDQVGHHL